MVFSFQKAGIGLLLLGLTVPTMAMARDYHLSFYSDQPERYAAIERHQNRTACTGIGSDLDIRAGIVTHHILAIELMAEFFECLSRNTTPDRVILIGPAHYAQTIDGLAISSLPWRTAFGDVASDASTTLRIQAELGVGSDIEAFSGEHSIGVLVPLVRYYFPKSKFVPIIIQRNVDIEKLSALKAILSRMLADPKTVVLLSMDFSHHQTEREADRRDQQARQVIENADYRKTGDLDIDCHAGLKVLLAALGDQRDIRTKILSHTNSAKITKEVDSSNVTSYFTVLFYQQRSRDQKQ